MTGTSNAATDPAHRVVIAGAGVAGLEAMVALRALAGGRVAITLVSPAPTFAFRADAVGAPFGRGKPVEHDVAAIAADHDAQLFRDEVRMVHRDLRTVVLAGGGALGYDSLVAAVGARPRPVYPNALTFRGAQDVAAMRELLADVEAGRATSIAFAVPSGASWTLPIYELALLTAEHAEAVGRDVALTIVTPEPLPAAALGHEAGMALAAALEQHGVSLRPGTRVQRVDGGALRDLHGRVHARADRIVALPLLTGPHVRGLPHDVDGFLPVDEHGAVRGVAHVYGAGDATTAPFKQGAVAAQQAEIAARRIALAAGVEVATPSLHATLRAHIETGAGETWFEAPAERPAMLGYGTIASKPLWSPPTKVAMPYLTAYLRRVGATP